MLQILVKLSGHTDMQFNDHFLFSYLHPCFWRQTHLYVTSNVPCVFKLIHLCLMFPGDWCQCQTRRSFSCMEGLTISPCSRTVASMERWGGVIIVVIRIQLDNVYQILQLSWLWMFVIILLLILLLFITVIALSIPICSSLWNVFGLAQMGKLFLTLWAQHICHNLIQSLSNRDVLQD